MPSSYNRRMKVFVGLSGGVDSAVSAALLQEQGYDVTGVFIRIVVPGYPCTAGEDKIDAQRVAAHLRIPFIEIDLSKEYEREVFRASLNDFSRGRTPNPDTLCNQKIKFGHFREFVQSRGADFIATGHYARVAPRDDLLQVRDFSAEKSLKSSAGRLRSPSEGHPVSLFGGIDAEKDQSYFLWMVPETVLRHTLFPVGSLQKSEVRDRARQFGLPNAARKDSQGLCFLGDISITDMLERELAPQPGDVRDEHGEVVGRHRGAVAYTLGQRHGFELRVQSGAPHYVVAKNIKLNTITVSTSPVPRGASGTRVTLADTNWIGAVLDGEYRARFRYRQKLIPARLQRVGKAVTVILAEPQYAPPGQSLVLYDLPRGKAGEERCIGGGIITDVELT